MSDSETMEQGLVSEKGRKNYTPPHKVWPKCFTITVVVTLVTASLLLGIWITVSEFKKLKSNQEINQQKILEVAEEQQHRDDMILKLKHKINHLKQEVEQKLGVEQDIPHIVHSKLHDNKDGRDKEVR